MITPEIKSFIFNENMFTLVVQMVTDAHFQFLVCLFCLFHFEADKTDL